MVFELSHYIEGDLSLISTKLNMRLLLYGNDGELQDASVESSTLLPGPKTSQEPKHKHQIGPGNYHSLRSSPTYALPAVRSDYFLANLTFFQVSWKFKELVKINFTTSEIIR